MSQSDPDDRRDDGPGAAVVATMRRAAGHARSACAHTDPVAAGARHPHRCGGRADLEEHPQP